MKNTVLIPQNHQKGLHFPFSFTPESENTCKCANPCLGLLDYKGVITLNVYQKTWQDEIMTYAYYIRNYNLQNGLKSVNSLDINNHVQWFDNCVECGKKVCNTISGNNIA